MGNKALIIKKGCYLLSDPLKTNSPQGPHRQNNLRGDVLER